MSDSTFTVGELKRLLFDASDDTKVSFAGGLSFYRMRHWDNEVFIEFNEAQGDLSPSFKKLNPHVKVVFIATESAEMDESRLISSLNVSVR